MQEVYMYVCMYYVNINLEQMDYVCIYMHVYGHHGLCNSLSFVVAGSGPDGVDMTPVALLLRVHFRVPIHL